MKDIVRVATAVPRLALGNVLENERAIAEKLREAAEKNVGVVVFPECALTGYTCGDLFFQKVLLDETEAALGRLTACVAENMLAVIGAPLKIGGALYNTAVWMTKGKILAVVPKMFVPTYREYDERRWFSSGEQLSLTSMTLSGFDVPCGALVLHTSDGMCIGTEICEDLFAPIPPSSSLALSGATLICNLSASNEAVAKQNYRRRMILEQPTRTTAAYVYASSGWHESTADMVFSGYSMVASNGVVQAETKSLFCEDYLLIADVDFGRLTHDRLVNRTFGEAASREKSDVQHVKTDVSVALSAAPTYLLLSKTPFIPENTEERQNVCRDIFDMQAYALARRLELTGGKVVLGVSGGLDSTLALLVATKSMDILGLPRTNIFALTLPCFGTTDATYQNAWDLMRTLGVTASEVRISDSVLAHFRDIGHDPQVHDVTYENSQARERTQVLMDYANRVGAIVLGTGDLSELALGWCTYNADHMSMYGVNADVPKTLIRHIIETVAKDDAYAHALPILLRVIDTPVSPELLPPDEKGRIAQKTEELVGPYILHDFFMYYVVRYAFSPEKVEELATLAFREEFDGKTIRHWLENFYRRFFSQQFKRNCLPDGVKVGTVSLSPRGDWQMPSDASARLWLDSLK